MTDEAPPTTAAPAGSSSGLGAETVQVRCVRGLSAWAITAMVEATNAGWEGDDAAEAHTYLCLRAVEVREPHKTTK